VPELKPLREALAASVGVTVLVALVAAVLPGTWHTTAVGVVFLAATWLLVWRKDDEYVRHAGLALGGLLIPGRLDTNAVSRAGAKAILWAVVVWLVVAVPFFLLWRLWWAPSFSFSLNVRPAEMANELLGQVFVIALPEEAFYRGYLQSRMDDAWPRRATVLGACVGPGLVAASCIFALGHLATVHLPARLAVFFPALLFGWLRARTGGIGASVFLHAFCNLYSQLLGRGYGIY
jgi:uncharacterized protein